MIKFYDQEINEKSLKSLCLQAILGNPQVPMQLHPMQGIQWLTELSDLLVNQRLYSNYKSVILELTEQTPPSNFLILSSFLNSRPKLICATKLYDLNMRFMSEDVRIRENLAKALSKELLDGEISYSKDLRVLATPNNMKIVLAGVYLIFDHEWMMRQLSSCFTGIEEDDRFTLLALVSSLSRGELLALAQEVEKTVYNITPIVAEKIKDYVSVKADSAFYADRGNQVRWS
jgi:hypothetical protein